jgi:hypothetical protein
MLTPKLFRRASFSSLSALMVFAMLSSCSEDANTNGNPSATTGGVAPMTTGGVSTGGKAATGGTLATGGTTPTTGGVVGTGGSTGGTSGGVVNGGTSGSSTGGASKGGTSSAGSAGKGGSSGGGGGAGGASGAGGTLSGGSGGGGAFDPCPAMGECKILPLGDSITDGIGFSGGYRVELFSKAVSAGKSITFVGKSANGPTMVAGKTFPRNHEGHSGWTIEQIDGIVETYALDPDPHIILLHIGTNDMRINANGASDRLEQLIDKIMADQPNALLALSNIIPFPSAANQTMTYNATIPAIVKERADAGKHIIFVEQFMGFPTSELGDGVHPNQAGYARMATAWYNAVSKYLH